jgi:hypothetical protein
MSTGIRVLTVLMLCIPAGFAVAVGLGNQTLRAPLYLVLGMYALVWLLFRPQRFSISSTVLEVAWPLRRSRILRSSIVSVRQVTAAELRALVGVGARVGVGGLWGGFGWLWTRHRGMVRMYVSRTDAFVWIERGEERPWLITPERPEEFVRALSAKVPASI